MDVAKARLVREEPPEGLTEVGREVFIDGLVAGIEQDLGGRGVYGIEVPLGLLLAAAEAHGENVQTPVSIGNIKRCHRAGALHTRQSIADRIHVGTARVVVVIGVDGCGDVDGLVWIYLAETDAPLEQHR